MSKKIAEVKRGKNGRIVNDEKVKKALKEEAEAHGLPPFDPDSVGIGEV